MCCPQTLNEYEYVFRYSCKGENRRDLNVPLATNVFANTHANIISHSSKISSRVNFKSPIFKDGANSNVHISIFKFQTFKIGTKLQFPIFSIGAKIAKPSPLPCVPCVLPIVNTIVGAGEQTPGPCASTWMEYAPPCRRRPGPLAKFKSQCPKTEPNSIFQI